MKSRLAVLFAVAVSALMAVAVPAGASNLYFASGDDGTKARAFAYSLDAEGLPAPLQTIEGATGGYYNAISMTPDGKFVFMVDYNTNELRSLSVGADGKLTDAPGSPKILPGDPGPYGSAVTPDGKFLMVGQYDERGVQAFAIGENGLLTAAPGGVFELDPAANPYGLAVSTDSQTVYVPDFATDSLYFLRIGPDGSLTELPGSPVPTGDNSYHAAVTPDGKYLYAPNQTSNNVSGYSLAADGTPTQLPGSPFAVMTNTYGGFALSPDGKTLYSSGSSEEIQSASIAPDGSLTAGPSIVTQNYNPGLTLNPSGTRLYNVEDDNGPGNALFTYSVGTGGTLTEIGTPLSIADPFNPDSDSLVETPAQPPVAALATVSGPGGEVSFDASASTDPDGPIATYAWDFGDGQTATTTVPTTSHTYATDGDYATTVTLTDTDGCSTELVFTGRTAYCNGSDVAMAAATGVADRTVSGAKVTGRKIQKQKGRQLIIKVKVGAAEAVKFEATGTARFKGIKGKVFLKKAKGQTAAGTSRTLKLVAKSKKKGRAAVRRKGKASISVKFTDLLGNSVTRKIKVRAIPSGANKRNSK